MSPFLTVVLYSILLSISISVASFIRIASSERCAEVTTVLATESILHCRRPDDANLETSLSINSAVTPNDCAI
uniref:Putative secreted protein n=1 Tax=Panstrongylus lignarius TaxID=156445 RepID=A0A224XU07_9HEMI